MRPVSPLKRMKTDRFLNSADVTERKEAAACMGYTYSQIYFGLSGFALILHAINCIGILAAYFHTLINIEQRYVFVSPTVNLRWTNYALVRVDSVETKCSDVGDSIFFQATSPALSNATRQAIAGFIPPRLAYPDFMDLYDFSNLAVVEYNRPGSTLNLDWMMAMFCLLSFAFQSMHFGLLWYYKDLPRFMHYLEYAFSSPLMVMVMAVNVGILELFAVVSLAGLFCGMNVLGLCAEVMLHYADQIKQQQSVYLGLCALVHGFGWVLFFLAIVPIWSQFTHVVDCSEHHGTPDYAYAAIVVESLLFSLFGVLQFVGLYEKMSHFSRYPNDPFPTASLFRYDCVHALLSVVAKTMLAWLLLGPALSVHIDRMGVRSY